MTPHHQNAPILAPSLLDLDLHCRIVEQKLTDGTRGKHAAEGGGRTIYSELNM